MIINRQMLTDQCNTIYDRVMKSALQLGEIIREHRVKKGLTQQQLAEQLGYDNPQFISLIERNASKCPLKVIGKLTVLLDIPEHRLLKEIRRSYEETILEEINQGRQLVLSFKEAQGS